MWTRPSRDQGLTVIILITNLWFHKWQGISWTSISILRRLYSIGLISSFSLYLWLYSPLDLARFFSFLILYIFGRTPWMGISPSQGRYLQNNTNRINAHRHPCLGWDWNLQSQCWRDHCHRPIGLTTCLQFWMIIFIPRFVTIVRQDITQIILEEGQFEYHIRRQVMYEVRGFLLFMVVVMDVYPKFKHTWSTFFEGNWERICE
jgi:hypothetical protein